MGKEKGEYLPKVGRRGEQRKFKCDGCGVVWYSDVVNDGEPHRFCLASPRGRLELKEALTE